MNPRTSPRIAWALAGLHLLLCASAFRDDRFLNDEGLLTQLFAQLVARDPLPTIFLQKVRPPLSILYAPVAGNLTAFLWAHALVGAGAVVALAAAARNLGHRAPNVAAAVLALSPMFVAGSASGVSNADAVAGLCVVVWAASSGRWLAAGIVMGTLGWVRAELVVVALALAAVAWMRGDRRFVVGLFVWPVAYGLAGTIYHQYIGWMLHYPPALRAPMPDNPFWDGHGGAPPLSQLSHTFFALSVVWPLALAVRWRELSPIERGLCVGTVVLLLALVGLPALRLFNFDQSPRYLMPVVVALALCVGRVAESDWTARSLHATAVLALGAALAILGFGDDGLAGPPYAIAATAAAVAVARAGWPMLARLGIATLLAIGPAAFTSGARIDRATMVPHVDEMLARLQEHAGELGERPIYTNEPILAAYLRRSGGLPQARVYYLVQADQVYELTQLTNPVNGQRQAIFAALSQGMYGTPVFPDELDPDGVAPGALFVLTGDVRLPLVMPPQRWAERTRVLHPGQRMQILERTEDGP